MQWNDNLMSRRVVLSLWRFTRYACCHMRPCHSCFSTFASYLSYSTSKLISYGFSLLLPSLLSMARNPSLDLVLKGPLFDSSRWKMPLSSTVTILFVPSLCFPHKLFSRPSALWPSPCSLACFTFLFL